MQIIEKYSRYHGLEFMLVRQPHLWRELERLIASVDANSYLSLSRGKRAGYIYQRLCRVFRERLGGLSWRRRRTFHWATADPQLVLDTCHLPARRQKQAILDAGGTPIRIHTFSGLINERITVIAPFEKRAVEHGTIEGQLNSAFFRNEIDIGIEILPMQSMLKDVLPGINNYEGELYSVIRNGRGVPAVPLVLVGIAP